ncbi:LPS export ABC transporter permease LptG [Rhodoferax saidenbachensis]|uniref:LPS export ABC transporter permease LptG n=1 Tax=Rhodoferax saidenbachensis TaxID=1484693 RepID=A0A1P8KA30_9BURK|nr:LPS export ABC transporter permease LptG [Rhodoferax saidenbachensis]APW42842.1 LPS export ABC transporter permease LptG [Rhodoferax saidenbachensis]
MRTLRRLFYGEMVTAVALVTLGFVALFFFFDFVEELQAIGRFGAAGYKLPQAMLYVTLMAPSHVYELLPITVLIGTIFVMARFAQSSEFTILRTSGLGPWRALRTLLLLGVGFVVFTFAVGDYLAPLADRTAQLLKSQYQGRITVGKTGAWLKEKQAYGNYSVNVGSLDSDGNMKDVRIFEFDNQGYLVSMTQGQSARFGEHEDWLLEKVDRTEFTTDTPSHRVDRAFSESFRWPTQISAEMVAAAVLRPERMGTIDLFQYIGHLEANGQSAQKYEVQFWKKVFYPLSCLVMVVLALPFAYLHFRSGSIATYVFGGVMAGISFVLLNNVLGDLGTLRGWAPWFTAALPGLIYSLLSLSAFGWLVIRR